MIICFKRLWASLWPDIILILGVALLPTLFFWRLITPTVADQQQIVAGDFTEQYFPLRAFTAREWVAGRVPLWNPSLFGGQPALADIQSGALYPPHIIQALVVGWAGYGFPLGALTWQVILHFSLAGVGAYLLGRAWGLQVNGHLQSARFMGLVVSLIFTYNGYLTGFPVQQMTILATSAWLPWVMWTLSKLLNTLEVTSSFRWVWPTVTAVGLTVALAILAGHPQTVMYIFYLCLIYILFRVLFSPKVNPKQMTGLKKLTLFGLYGGSGLALGFMLAAAQLWPTLEFIQHSLRADLSYNAVAEGLPLSELVSIIYPGYFGGSPQYVGIFTLMLIAVPLVLGRFLQPKQTFLRGSIIFWSIIGLGSLLIAFGGNTFLYPLIYLLLPGFDAVRQQERIFLIYTLAAAVLAGYGVLMLSWPLSPSLKYAWQTLQRNLQWVAIGAGGLTLIFMYGAVATNTQGGDVNLFNGVLRHHLFGLIIWGGGLVLFAWRPGNLWRRTWGQALVALWLIFNLFTINWQFNLEARPPGTPFILEGVSQFLGGEIEPGRQPVRIASDGLLSGGHNAAVVYNLEDITGNTPLQLANVVAFAEAIPAWRYWQLFNVLYVMDERDLDGPGLTRRYEAEGVSVYEVGDPFARARIVHSVIPAEDIAILAAETSDLKHTALVLPDFPVSFEQPAQPSIATVTESIPGLLVVQTTTQADGLLILSNIDYPGWEGTLDGKVTKIYRVNGIFQGVVVPAGTHQIEIQFSPASFRWGVIISVIGLLLVGCGLWLYLTR